MNTVTPRIDATSTIDALDGTITFNHYRSESELIHVKVTDQNGKSSEVTVNRGQFEVAFQVVRYA